MEQIKDTIKALFEDWQRPTKPSSAIAGQSLLKKIFPPRELKHTRFVSVKNGVLNIKVDSSAWLYQLNLRREQLLEKITKESPEIQNVRFSVGNISPGKSR